jgi:hypothetical protein
MGARTWGNTKLIVGQLRSILLGSIGLIDSSDSVCRILASDGTLQNGRILRKL